MRDNPTQLDFVAVFDALTSGRLLPGRLAATGFISRPTGPATYDAQGQAPQPIEYLSPQRMAGHRDADRQGLPGVPGVGGLHRTAVG
ncbi:hypothetical protein D3C73_837790 [compost metagenome]